MKYHRNRLPKGNLFNYVDKRKPLKKQARVQVAKISNRVYNKNVEKEVVYLWQNQTAASNTMVTFITTSNTVGNIWDISKYGIPAAGITPFTSVRTGTKAKLHKLEIVAELVPNTGVTFNCIRLVVFKFKPSTAGGNPTEGILFGIPNAVSVGNNALSPITNNIKSEYTMLYDKTHVISYQGGKDSGKVVRINLYGKKLPKVTCFDATNSDDGTDHIFYAFLSDLAATQPNVKTNIKLTFSDA